VVGCRSGDARCAGRSGALRAEPLRVSGKAACRYRKGRVVSSLIRRLQIRMMKKRAGYTREKWILVKNKRGDLVPQSVKRGGEITDHNDNPIGRHWPRFMPKRFA
jgi:hypothetical protein